MNPFAQLWATFLAWYHSPTRILSKLDSVRDRLTASAQHHNAQAAAKTALFVVAVSGPTGSATWRRSVGPSTRARLASRRLANACSR